MNKSEPRAARAGSYSAVPPPPPPPPLCPNPVMISKRNPGPFDKNSDSKSRRRRHRLPKEFPDSDGNSSSCPSGPSDCGTSRRRGIPTEPSDCASPLRSPSPSCMPSPNFPGNRCQTARGAKLEQCSTHRVGAHQGISCSSPGSAANGLTRSGSGFCSKSRSKESVPVPIPKSKRNETSKTPVSTNEPSPSGKGLFIKSDKFTYSLKVKVDNSRDTRSTQLCNHADDALRGSYVLQEEASASNFQGECRSSGDDPDFDHLWKQGSSDALLAVDRGRRDQKPRCGRVSSQKNCYSLYWPSEKVNRALEAGELFCAKIRANAHNRSEAYVSLDGVPTDILIEGIRAQNRAIDGDVVAVSINPASTWPKLRGSIGKQNNVDLSAGLNDISLVNINLLSTEIQVFSSDEGQFDCVENREQASTSGRPDMKPSKGTAVDISSEAKLRHSEAGMTSEIVMNSKYHAQKNLKTPNLQIKDNKSEQQQHGFLQVEVKEICSSRNAKKALDDLAARVATFFDRRPTGEVVAILEKSNRREAVVGFLEAHLKVKNKCREDSPKKLGRNNASTVMFRPSDTRFPKMVVSVTSLPNDLKKRFQVGDETLGSELVAAHVTDWRPDNFAPYAMISHTLGQGGEIEAQTAAILFEHAIHSAEFPSAVLDCLPKTPWKIPAQEWKRRKDLRECRVFSIDPPTARDLDDALSFERLENGLVRIGVHISDVSYFVCPDTALDKEAQIRSTSIYLIQRVLPMLPRLLCEELCSLNPGVDRLAFSVIWDFNALGEIVDHWIGRTIIRSCCKLSYIHAQEMIDSKFKADDDEEGESCSVESVLPELFGNFKWMDVTDDVKALYVIAKQRRHERFEAGALKLDNSKLVFELDANGVPSDSSLYEHQDSNFLVEEFMLLANMTVAKVISGAFPDCALLRRHPEPNMRKLKELEEFCTKNGFDLDASTSNALHESLKRLREHLKEDPILCNILMLYATKPMQLAKYFSTGELKDREEEWAHYALATPCYTHFTSPIRRYPDIVVHRTLAAALEAEAMLCETSGSPVKRKKAADVSSAKLESSPRSRCLTGPCIDKRRAESPAGQKALATAASKHKIPGSLELAIVAEHCNERKLASRNVRDANDKLYLWALLKKNKGMLSEARVLAVGPKFVSLYVHKIAMERRIYYEETEGLTVEWLETTGTVVLNLVSQKGFLKKQRQERCREFSDVVYLVNPADSCNIILDSQRFEEVFSDVQERLQGNLTMDDELVFEPEEDSETDKKLEPAVLPLILHHLAAVPVHVYAVGGEDRPLDIGVRLYLSSYLS